MKKQDLATVLNLIRTSALNAVEIKEIQRAVKEKIDTLQGQVRGQLVVGGQVSFVNKHGRKVVGKLIEIRVKRGMVVAQGTQYSVPIALLTVE